MDWLSSTRRIHPKDLIPLLIRQIYEPNWDAPKLLMLAEGLKTPCH